MKFLDPNEKKDELITISRDDFKKSVMKSMDDILSDLDTENSPGIMIFALSVPVIGRRIEENLFDSDKDLELNS